MKYTKVYKVVLLLLLKDKHELLKLSLITIILGSLNWGLD